MKKNKLQKGRFGEDQAAKYLQDKGCQIQHRNWRTGHLEIDIIAYDPNCKILIFVEVKLRQTADFGYPEEAVNRKKMDKLQSAIERYVAEFDYQGAIRMDLISVIVDPFQIEHFEDVV